MKDIKRLRITELLAKSAEYVGKEIDVKGWVRTRRGNKNVQFVALNDGSTIKNLQIVFDLSNFSEEDLTSIKKEYLDYTETYYNKYKEELTSTEKEFVVKLKARYYAVMAKQGLKDVGSALKDLGEQANDLINNMLK